MNYVNYLEINENEREILNINRPFFGNRVMFTLACYMAQYL